MMRRETICPENRGKLTRYYDPSTGRFHSQDPLHLVQRYSYVSNNPVLYVDPYGLYGLKDIKRGAKKVAKKTVDFAGDEVGSRLGATAVVALDVTSAGFTTAAAIVTDANTIAGCWRGGLAGYAVTGTIAGAAGGCAIGGVIGYYTGRRESLLMSAEAL